MRGWMLVGGFVAGALACSASSTFACMEDSECTLSGMPGVCAAGNCAYPSETCESGYVYPDGAPGNLPGMCADVEGDTGSVDMGTGPAESTGPSNDSTGGSTVALDDGATTSSTTSDETTTSVGTSVGSSDGTGSEAGEASSSGGCSSIELELEPVADAFMTDVCAMMMGCELFNYGATPEHPVGDTGLQQSVMAIRFDTAELLEVGLSEVQSVELRLFYGLDDSDVSGTLRVGVLSPEYQWVEGAQVGMPAADGESCWASAQYQFVDWPAGGPPAAVVADVGEFDLENELGADMIATPLSASKLTEEVISGGDSLLVYGPIESGSLFVFSRESGFSPVLHLIGC